MFLRVRIAGKEDVTLYNLSKFTMVDEVREKAASAFGIDPSVLLLIGKGKILEDGQQLLHYRLEDGLTIFAQERRIKRASNSDKDHSPGDDCTKEGDDLVEMVDAESKYFDVGQQIDVQMEDGSWYPAKVQRICQDQTEGNETGQADENNLDSDGLVYYCQYEEPPHEISTVQLYRIRPRAHEKVMINSSMVESMLVNDGQPVRRYLVNYNIECPTEMGSWYEADIEWKEISSKTRIRNVIATVYSGSGQETIAIPNCKIMKIDEIYIFPERCPKSNTSRLVKKGASVVPVCPMRTMLDCHFCFDNPQKKSSCLHCICVVCRTRENDDKLLICEECSEAYHTYCCSPPFDEIPEDDYYCPECKVDHSEIVKAGETKKLLTRKLLNMPSAKAGGHWGRGQCCDGVSKKSIMPRNHFGSIPGVEIGTCWRYRKQVSAAGVHRPLVSGIHAREDEGAYSIVLAGGYVDDIDEGNRIIFTGSGGRDLTGNKRVAGQSCDQTLNKNNAGLARNCYGPNHTKPSPKGFDAGTAWKRGKPVRVVRGYKVKEKKYAPKEGFRYDGIYKVVRYWPEKGRDGFIVWRYELRRDDPSPAPWTKEGLAAIKKKGLDHVIEVEDGIENKSIPDADNSSDTEEKSGKKKAKRQKVAGYKIPEEQLNLIKKDVRNSSHWNVCLMEASNGSMKFIEKVVDEFTCAICQQPVHRPATLACGHSLCMICINRAKKSGYNECPSCRAPMKGDDSDEKIMVNENLTKALESLMPGYAKDREGKR